MTKDKNSFEYGVLSRVIELEKRFDTDMANIGSTLAQYSKSIKVVTETAEIRREYVDAGMQLQHKYIDVLQESVRINREMIRMPWWKRWFFTGNWSSND